MTMISLEQAVKLVKRSADTLHRWRLGCYYRYIKEDGSSMKLFFYPDERKLFAINQQGVWMFNKKEVLQWAEELNRRGPNIRKER